MARQWHIDADSIMLLRVRTTIDINDELLRAAKRRAADDRAPLKRVIESALLNYLGGKERAPMDYRLDWHTEHGRIQAGVRLDDRDALFDRMEGR